MYDSNSKGISYTAGFFILIGFTISAFLLAYIISIPIWTLMTGQTAKEMESGILNPEYSDAIIVVTTITALIGFFLPTIVVAAILNKKPIRLLGFTGNIKGSQWAITILIVLFAMIVSVALAYLNNIIPLTDNLKIFVDKLEKKYNEQVEAIINLNNFADYLIAVGIMGFIPAVCEETLFRGGFQNFLTRSTKRPWLSIIIVSLIFSGVHLSFYGFLSRFFLGIMLGLLFYYSGRLWLSILAHFINNFFAVTAIYILTLRGSSEKEAISESYNIWWGIFALPIVVVLFFWFRRVSKKEKEENPAPVQNHPGDLFC